MKRSEINEAIRYAKNTLEKNHIRLPAFAYWTLEEWKKQQGDLANIKAVGLGWDVTDFGYGDFLRTGSVLFTVRNGSHLDPKAGTPYAEKIILQRHESQQEIPLHFHRVKTEDIINRGGGILCIELFNSLSDDGLDNKSDVETMLDGIVHSFPAGAIIEIEKGCSITLRPGLYHRFWAKKGEGDLVVGEVSSVNDDAGDNIFFKAISRFSEIEEDESAVVPLCNEYEKWL